MTNNQSKKVTKAINLYQTRSDLSFTEICKICKISQTALTLALQRNNISKRIYARKTKNSTTNSQTPEPKKSPSKPTPVANKTSPQKTSQNKKSNPKKEKKSSSKKTLTIENLNNSMYNSFPDKVKKNAMMMNEICKK